MPQKHAWALGRFNEIALQETITTLTLTTAGREISLDALTDLLRVTRVWWPYTAASPQYTPSWTRCEQWGLGSDATLYLDTPTEPQSGDTVRGFSGFGDGITGDEFDEGTDGCQGQDKLPNWGFYHWP